MGDVLTSFGSNKKEKIEIVNDIVTAQTNSTHMDVHMFGETYGSTLGNIGEFLDEWYKKTGVDPNTHVTGLILFDERVKK